MKLLLNSFPIVLFFITFKIYGIYVATITMIVATLLQISIIWLKHRKVKSLHLITLVLVVILGSATIFLKNEIYIKWKPTIVSWGSALLLLGSQLFTEKSIIERIMGDKITLPKDIWCYLSISWIIFFICVGISNLYVAYSYSTNIWVNFKLFGVLGSTIILTILQAFYLSKYLTTKDLYIERK